MVEKPSEKQVEHIPVGEIVAEGVSADEYMARYAADHHEWVRGFVVKMSPISSAHNDIDDYIRQLLAAYFVLNPIGQRKTHPFVMRLDNVLSRREPDIQVILGDNLQNLEENAMVGAADICIEIVSKESVQRDYEEKRDEYESAGVREYWIIDPLEKVATFYRRNDDGKFDEVDTDETFTTPLLPRFALHIPTLWLDDLPDIFAVTETVKSWFND